MSADLSLFFSEPLLPIRFCSDLVPSGRQVFTWVDAELVIIGDGCWVKVMGEGEDKGEGEGEG